MFSSVFWVSLFSIFLSGSMKPLELDTKQPAPILKNIPQQQGNTCSPYPECKLD